jgi:hypothetical protein
MTTDALQEMAPGLKIGNGTNEVRPADVRRADRAVA